MERGGLVIPNLTGGDPDSMEQLEIPNLTGGSRKDPKPLSMPKSARRGGKRALAPQPAGKPVRNVVPLLQEAINLLKSGKFREAERACREILAEFPEQAGALHVMGLIAYHTGNFPKAVEFLQAAVDQDGSVADFQNALGAALLASQRHQEALAAYQKAIQLNPEYAEAYYNMANVVRELGDTLQAICYYEKAVELNPKYHRAYNNLGVLLQEIGRIPDAISAYEKCLSHNPDQVEARKNLGNIYISQGRLEEARACFSEALRISPGYLCAIGGQAAILEKEGKYVEAYQLLRPHLAAGLGDSENTAGTFARLAGYVDKAEEALAMMQRMLDQERLSNVSRKSLFFSLGYLADKLGRYDEAFAYYREGNDLKRMQYDGPGYMKWFDNLIVNYSPGRMAVFPRPSFPTSLPVFILGMPRSGTSLVEQILASHPQVFGAGELEYIKETAVGLPRTLNTGIPYPFCLQALHQDAVDALSRDYMNRLLGLAERQDVARVTDKMPHNFLHVGLIRLLFPEASIIHCLREPLDNCLSIYFQDFSGLHPYSYNLRDLGHYYRLYERLMSHWRDTLEIPMLEIRYEEMVADHETMSRRIIDHCGLAWDDRCLDFHKTKRLVNTASYQQVREPIYKKSAGRWRHYERHLQPLIESLDNWLM